MNNIEKLIKLKQENPELEIVPFVDYEVCCGDDFKYWAGRIESVDKETVWRSDERIYFDEDEIKEEMAEIITYENKSMTKKDIDCKVEQKYQKETKKIICIKIGMP